MTVEYLCTNLFLLICCCNATRSTGRGFHQSLKPSCRESLPSAAATSERSAADVGWYQPPHQRFCSTQRDCGRGCVLSSHVPSADYGSAVISKQEMVFPKQLPSCWKSCRQNGYKPPSDCDWLCCLSAGLCTVDVHLNVQRNLEEMQTIKTNKKHIQNESLSLCRSLWTGLWRICVIIVSVPAAGITKWMQSSPCISSQSTHRWLVQRRRELSSV